MTWYSKSFCLLRFHYTKTTRHIKNDLVPEDFLLSSGTFFHGTTDDIYHHQHTSIDYGGFMARECKNVFCISLLFLWVTAYLYFLINLKINNSIYLIFICLSFIFNIYLSIIYLSVYLYIIFLFIDW